MERKDLLWRSESGVWKALTMKAFPDYFDVDHESATLQGISEHTSVRDYQRRTTRKSRQKILRRSDIPCAEHFPSKQNIVLEVNQAPPRTIRQPRR